MTLEPKQCPSLDISKRAELLLASSEVTFQGYAAFGVNTYSTFDQWAFHVGIIEASSEPKALDKR